MSARANPLSIDDRYRQLADAMPQIVWTSDATGATTYFNWRWFEYTGMAPEDAGPNAWRLIVHPDDLPSVIARREQTLKSGETFETEYRFRGADGRYRWHLGRAVPLRAADGSIELWVGTATDIDDRKRVEEQRSFIVSAGDMLSSSLDYRDTLGDVAELAAARDRRLVRRPRRGAGRDDRPACDRPRIRESR